MLLNVRDKDYEVIDDNIIIKRRGIASKAYIPLSVVDKITDNTYTSGVVVIPSRESKALYFEEPTNEEYGVLITDNFGVGNINDISSIDIVTMGDYVYIEVYAGKVYFRSHIDGLVYSVDSDGEVKKCTDTKIYWIDNVSKYIEDTVGRTLELRYSACDKNSIVNNTALSLDVSIKKESGYLGKNGSDIFELYMKVTNVNVSVGIGDFTLANGVDTEEFTITDDTSYYDEDESVDIDNEQDEDTESDKLNRIDIAPNDDYIDDDDEWD